MTHVYSLGSLLGVPGAATIAQTTMAGLLGRLHDDEHGGWFTSVDAEGRAAPGKSCYDHAFVLLAASSAARADIDGATALFEDARRVFL